MDNKEIQALLFSAIQHHNESLLTDLLDGETGAELLDVPGGDGYMLLHAAVMENDLKCVECLLKKGADPNVYDANQARTPLHLAVELGQVDTVKAFLKLDHVNLESRDDRNLTCHEIAQYCDNENLADLLATRLEEIEKFRNNFYSVINQACTSNKPRLVKETLEKYERQIISNLPKDWHPQKDCRQIARSNLKQLINWSSSSWNDVTLLFKSASMGHTEVCKILIEFGATAKCNDNTNYSPLYVAAYGGFTETAKLLLDNFPSLVQEITIEKWTVLHACCLQGHSDTAKLILNYTYPETLKRRYVSRSGTYEYRFAFDLNAQDAAGQTVIYLAVSANNEKLLDTLLHFNIEATLLRPANPTSDDGHHGLKGTNQTRQSKGDNTNNRTRVISERFKGANEEGEKSNYMIDKLIRLLQKTGTRTDENDQVNKKEDKAAENKYLICPFEMDTYCDYNSKTALHLAVSQQYHNIATTLLVNGSNPNLPILSRDSIKSDFTSPNVAIAKGSSDGGGFGADIGLNWLRSSKSTCLKEACRLNDDTMCEILIRYGASDNQDNLALQMAALNKNNKLISMFLSLKSNIDPEHKINKKCNIEFASRFKQNQKFSKTIFGDTSTTFSSMFPSSPVTIDWRNLRCIKQIDPQWLIDASLMHNKRLRHPTNSLMAITRLDLSSNNLKTVHPVIFRLPSLRELNLSNNRLESLLDAGQRNISHEGEVIQTTSKLIESQRTAMKRSKSSNLSSFSLENSNVIDLNEPQEWDLPYLTSLDLHDNLLISLPDCLFQLPRLRELDVSSNQIRQLPWAVWTAPSLKELIASSNLLDDLPKVAPQAVGRHSIGIQDGRLSAISDSTAEECNSSLTSNQSFEKSGGSYQVDLEDSELEEQPSYIKHLKPNEVTDVKLVSHPSDVDHINHWQRRVEVVEKAPQTTRDNDDEGSSELNDASTISKITYLNLSHNSFQYVPPVLACITTEITRLNMSYNRLETLGDIGLYPAKLKNLDLSHNQIVDWFQFDQQDSDTKHCYLENVRRSSQKFTQRNLTMICVHKIHTRLDNLRSVNLSHNRLRDIQIYQPADQPDLLNQSNTSRNSTRSSLASSSTSPKSQPLYPIVTLLDLSHNRLQRIPANMSDLKDLSVLNLSGNGAITTLPPELGLASKLWNLGVAGCSLGDPLKSIVESKSYKTMDVIGYLRSILEEAKPYVRMKLMLVGLQGIGKTSLLEQMRLEGTTSSRRRAPEHWTKRMGHTSRSNLRNQKGVTLSTVGVDIHDWIFCKRTPRNQPSFGPVTFSTWDFGGQEEFYATHRYFLSKRSMYLVVWRLTDGINGILGIQQWLVNIQSRAPNSPVIIVATHEDLVEGGERGETVQRLQAEVQRRFINISDQDKCGLPRVMDSIVVSTRTKLNIKNLCNRIYDVVFSLRCPGSTERLLEQKIPATYLYLEEIVSSIVHERHQKKREPVLTYEEFKKIASDQLKIKYHKTFRDLEPLNSREINYNSELQQATRFLHENGVLLHYEDSNLRDLYFLDPQWLCDILSHVVTIREINPHVRNGLMKIDDLNYLFKSIDINLSGGTQSYVVNLLNKFEVALTWNSQYLLIPSLLPDDARSLKESGDFQLKMVPRPRGRSAVRRLDHIRATNRSISIGPNRKVGQTTNISTGYFYEFEYEPERALSRIVLLRYLPAGFLARLQSGILSDPTFDDVCVDLQCALLDKVNREDNLDLFKSIGDRTAWTCWKSGIQLNLGKESTINAPSTGDESSRLAPCILSIQEYANSNLRKNDNQLDKIDFKVECVQLGHPKDPLTSPTSSKTTPTIATSRRTSDVLDVDIIGSEWSDLDINQYSNTIIMTVPAPKLKITSKEDRSVVRYVELDHLSLCRLLAKSVDHIDNLLEDWYPSLGARFAHTLGGNYLVTRIVPCRACSILLPQCHLPAPSSRSRQETTIRTLRSNNIHNNNGGTIPFSINSARDGSSIGATTTALQNNQSDLAPGLHQVYCFYIEHCILGAYNLTTRGLAQSRLSIDSQVPAAHQNLKSKIRNHRCPKHGPLQLASIAPDIVFDDIPDEFKLDVGQIDRCKLIGRGTLGFVFKGTLRSAYPINELGLANQEFALKLLQPVDPGPEAEHSDLVQYKSAISSWFREPFQSSCKSYCSARQEVNILQTLNHPNIVSFIGLCVKPLAIILELAPLGCLSDVFKSYKRAGLRIDQFSVQKSIIQVAKALEFLHQQRVIYRDLKTENVLVWSFPSPYATQFKKPNTVELKLADYGISRQTSSTGIWKGFAGTISFLAPEILRHNGDEEYTEKVDCFSFGMFMYELLTLRPPYKQQNEQGARSHLTEGGRPTLTTSDLIYPDYMFDLMTACWSQEPHDRPSASQIVSIASTPEFTQILDIVSLDHCNTSCCHCVQYNDDKLDVWIHSTGDLGGQFSILSATKSRWRQKLSLESLDLSSRQPHSATDKISGMCLVDNRIWFCGDKHEIHSYPTGSRLILEDKMIDPNASNSQPNKGLDNMQRFKLRYKDDIDESKIKVVSMTFVESAQCVVVLMSDGQLWICHLDQMDCQKLEGGSMQFNCVVADGSGGRNSSCPCNQRDTENHHDCQARGFRLFCGQSNGVSILDICNGEVRRQSIWPLACRPASAGSQDGEQQQQQQQQQLMSLESTNDNNDISHIVSSNDLLWTVAGCTVHMWSIPDKHVVRKLDCVKLVPCSESLESINIEQYYEGARTSHITGLVHSEDQLFVGTSHGCFITIEARTLKPMIVFRPFESELRILYPVVFNRPNDNNNRGQQATTESSSSNPDNYLVITGTNYRDLLRRYVGHLTSDGDQQHHHQQGSNSAVFILMDANRWGAEFYGSMGDFR